MEVHIPDNEDNIYDIYKLNKEKTKWFYGIKTMNNPCMINMYLNNEGELYENQNCIAFVDKGRGIMNYKHQWYWSIFGGKIKEGWFSFNFA